MEESLLEHEITTVDEKNTDTDNVLYYWSRRKICNDHAQIHTFQNYENKRVDYLRVKRTMVLENKTHETILITWAG